MVRRQILKSQRIGYVRVSSFDQNPERQLDQVQVEKMFTGKASGKGHAAAAARLPAVVRPRRRHSSRAQHGPPGAQPR
jgi:hypothetical protein